MFVRCFVVLLLLSIPTRSGLASDVIQVVVVAQQLQDESPDRTSDQLRAAIEAHLSTYPTVVTTARDVAAPEVVARTWFDRGAQAAVWLTDDGRLALLAPALGAATRYRQAPDSGEGWASRCEMIAAMVLSEFEPLLEGRTGYRQPEPVQVETAVPPAPPNEAERVETVASATTTVPSPVRMWVGASYLPILFSADGPYLNGLGLHGALCIGGAFQIDVAADVVQPAAFEWARGSGTLSRLPLRPGLTVRRSLGKFDVGIHAAAIVEVWRVLTTGYEPADPEAATRRVNGGVTFATRLRARPVPWLAPFVDLGIDLYPIRVGVGVGDLELLHRPRAMLRIAVGISAGGPIR